MEKSQANAKSILEMAHGAAWKHEAIQSISDYLGKKLNGQPVIILA